MFRRIITSASMVRHIEASTRQFLTIGLSPNTHRITNSVNNNERYFSATSQPIPFSVTHPLDSASELDEFMSVFPDLVRDVTAVVNMYDQTDAADASKWLAKAMFYNVPKGKRNRGLLVVSTYKLLQSQNESNETYLENVRKAQLLGWCIEMFQALFLIVDDIMDHSLTRRGVPCWYKVPEVGLTAANDSLMIENSIYRLLQLHLSDHPNYIRIVELFHEAMLVTSIGESLDLQSAEKQLDAFTLDQYTAIVHNKTAFYSFYLPVATALLMAGHQNASHFAIAKDILYEIGFFFQVQDDYLDCFGDPAVTGKIGTDIQDKKCSWFAVQCLSMANAEQRKVMETCYGKHNEEDVQRIKALYDELELPRLYSEFEQKSYEEIGKRIQQLPDDLPKVIFYNVMNVIYRRKH